MSPIIPRDAHASPSDDSSRTERTAELSRAGALPPFDDPANRQETAADAQGNPPSVLPADALAKRNDDQAAHAPRDTEYAGHPDFSQDAANNEIPAGIGNSEPVDDVDQETRHSDGVNPGEASWPQT